MLFAFSATRRKWFSDSPRKRHYIGINMLTLQPSIIQELKRFGVDFPSDVTTGVLVNDVHAQSPAFKYVCRIPFKNSFSSSLSFSVKEPERAVDT